MIRIAITQAAFDAIARTLALGSMNFENATKGARRALRLAGPCRDRPPARHARAWRELQRRDFAAGGGKRLNL